MNEKENMCKVSNLIILRASYPFFFGIIKVMIIHYSKELGEHLFVTS